MSEHENLVDAYGRAWFDPDPDKRQQFLLQAVEQDVIYTDPTVHIVGIQSLANHIRRIVEARPGFWLERTSPVDGHHDFIRFGWVQRRPDGFRGADSIDVCRISSNGKLSLIVGFFGSLSELVR